MTDVDRRARLLVKAELRFRRRTEAYDLARRSQADGIRDTWRLARLIVDADRLVRSLAAYR